MVYRRQGWLERRMRADPRLLMVVKAAWIRVIRLASISPSTDPASPDRLRFWPEAGAWRNIMVHVLIPLVMGTGMAFAYLGAFHSPDPHNVPMAVVGEGPATKVLAQSLNDAADGKLLVTTVPSADVARQKIQNQTIYAA